MPIRLAVNGFGRIGRYLIRLLADASDVEIVAVNARADNATLAHLLKYDSTFGPFPFPVSLVYSLLAGILYRRNILHQE